MRKVLVLEDEANIRSFVVINLKRAGYDTLEASSGEEAMEIVKRNPDIRVALLDVMLPGIDGFEVCRRIRADNAKIGIIMLTARTQEMDKVTGLMTGADDYVTKPFSPAELTARVDALYRRTGGEPLLENGVIRQDPFLLNTRNRPAHQADAGGVFYHQAVHGQSRQGALPGRDFGVRLGQRLLRRGEDRGCEYPPSPPEGGGRPTESHLYHHCLGLRI